MLPRRNGGGCLRGEHTEAILQELGYNEEQIAELAAKKVVFGPD